MLLFTIADYLFIFLQILLFAGFLLGLLFLQRYIYKRFPRKQKKIKQLEYFAKNNDGKFKIGIFFSPRVTFEYEDLDAEIIFHAGRVERLEISFYSKKKRWQIADLEDIKSSNSPEIINLYQKLKQAGETKKIKHIYFGKHRAEITYGLWIKETLDFEKTVFEILSDFYQLSNFYLGRFA